MPEQSPHHIDTGSDPADAWVCPWLEQLARDDENEAARPAIPTGELVALDPLALLALLGVQA